MLGRRDPSQYGSETLEQINDRIMKKARELNIDVYFFQSNHEGKLIDFIQKEAKTTQGIIINPGALSHYGYSLHDALLDTKLPIVEVHLSDISTRKEEWRRNSIITPIANKTIMGKRGGGYIEALEVFGNKK